jgi:hypothetical protein
MDKELLLKTLSEVYKNKKILFAVATKNEKYPYLCSYKQVYDAITNKKVCDTIDTIYVMQLQGKIVDYIYEPCLEDTMADCNSDAKNKKASTIFWE